MIRKDGTLMKLIKDMNEFMINSKIMLDNMVKNLENLPAIELDSLDEEKTLHTIVDMNNGFAKAGALYSPRVEALISNIVNLTKKGLEKEIITIAYTDTHTKESPEFRSYPEHCVIGTEEPKLIKELDELVGIGNNGIHKISKNSTNGVMAANPLKDGLLDYFPDERINKLNTFIITGCVTDVCVYQYATTLKAYLNENNIDARVIVPIDCVDTFDIPNVHDAEFMNVVFLNSMIANGIEIVKSIE